MEIIPRPTYLEHITRLLGKGMMLILVGQRRVGKSFVLRQTKAWIESNVAESNVIYINKESKDYDEVVDADSLNAYVGKELKEGKKKGIIYNLT